MNGTRRSVRLFGENLQEGIWEIDENITTTFVNPYLASLLGITTEEMIGKNALDFRCLGRAP